MVRPSLHAYHTLLHGIIPGPWHLLPGLLQWPLKDSYASTTLLQTRFLIIIKGIAVKQRLDHGCQKPVRDSPSSRAGTTTWESAEGKKKQKWMPGPWVGNGEQWRLWWTGAWLSKDIQSQNSIKSPVSQIKLVLIMSVVLDCQHVRAGLESEVPWPGLQGLASFLLSPDLKFTQLSNCLQFLCTCPAGPQLCTLIKPGIPFP